MRAPFYLPVYLALATLLAVGRAFAAPEAGATLPALSAEDVTGAPRQLVDLLHGPTLLVAITDRGGGDAMQAWFDAADLRGPDVNRVSIISIGVPFFVSDGYARSQAREQVPRAWWHATLFDSDHSMAKKLGLQEDEIPYAFAVGGDGHVRAVVHGRPGALEAQQVWRALDQLAAGGAARR